jgi:hypothetical protein
MRGTGSDAAPKRNMFENQWVTEKTDGANVDWRGKNVEKM